MKYYAIKRRIKNRVIAKSAITLFNNTTNVKRHFQGDTSPEYRRHFLCTGVIQCGFRM